MTASRPNNRGIWTCIGPRGIEHTLMKGSYYYNINLNWLADSDKILRKRKQDIPSPGGRLVIRYLDSTADPIYFVELLKANDYPSFQK